MAEINIDDFKPNSNKYKQEQIVKGDSGNTPAVKKVEKVVSGTATKKKKSLGRRLFDIFIDEDVGDVKTYLVYDVLVPAIKENIADMLGFITNIYSPKRDTKSVPTSGGACIITKAIAPSNERMTRIPT